MLSEEHFRALLWLKQRENGNDGLACTSSSVTFIKASPSCSASMNRAQLVCSNASLAPDRADFTTHLCTDPS